MSLDIIQTTIFHLSTNNVLDSYRIPSAALGVGVLDKFPPASFWRPTSNVSFTLSASACFGSAHPDEHSKANFPWLHVVCLLREHLSHFHSKILSLTHRTQSHRLHLTKIAPAVLTSLLGHQSFNILQK